MNRRRGVLIGAFTVLVVGAIGLSLGSYPGTPSSARPPRRINRRQQAAATPTLRVVAISPPNGSIEFSATAPISIEFSAPISSSSAMPSVDPSVPGRWSPSGDRLTFVPSEPFVPLGQVTVSLQQEITVSSRRATKCWRTR